MLTRFAARSATRTVLSRFTTGVVAAALACMATSVHAAEKVIFAWVPAIDALPYMVALEEKAFEKVGIEVVDQRLNSPAGLVDAFIADRAEVGPYGTAPGIAMVAESQHPGSLRIFGLSGGAADTPYVNSTLLVRKGSPIKTLQDLKGKKLGHNPGGQWRTNVRYILHAMNVNESDVTLIELPFPQQVPALLAGTVDATITIDPFAASGLATGDLEAPLINVGAKYVANPWFGGCAVMTTKFLKERPETARKVMLVLRDITKRIEADFDKYKPLLAKYAGVPPASMTYVRPLMFRNDEQINDRDIGAMQKVLDIYAKEGALGSKIDFPSKLVRLNDLK
ncbi:MAG TPA: ABC transporter substrate-binding protein [Burkholderiales bacterium]|nr:ABC transporter substrate-binding protein [Burkholderiales bacterium]